MAKNHVFINYAHPGNQLLSESEKGWMCDFDESLTIFLNGKIGREAKVWRDLQMTRNILFKELDSETIVHYLDLIAKIDMNNDPERAKKYFKQAFPITGKISKTSMFSLAFKLKYAVKQCVI
ncbi:MAG: hypothetical protein LUM44_07350 [Pyrinomonadaceae bacterium]|nr:hypothetical protein [Pyrinomonadaceae bacterium]